MNLRGTGQLAGHQASVPELHQHLEHARDQLADARNGTVSKIGRFNAAYGASHALLTAAIKLHGSRPTGTGHRQTLFALADQRPFKQAPRQNARSEWVRRSTAAPQLSESRDGDQDRGAQGGVGDEQKGSMHGGLLFGCCAMKRKPPRVTASVR